MQFDYDLKVLGHLNQSPAFITEPVMEVALSQSGGYVYDALAKDPEDGPLTYRLAFGPVGMQVDSQTGQVTLDPAQLNVGTYSVELEAVDPLGAVARQSYLLDVTDPPNRPPVFTSSPIVDAYTHSLYVYDADASDADGDTLAYAVTMTGPGGEIITPDDFDNSTGRIEWMPAPQYANRIVDVVVTADDGNGGESIQEYSIYVNLVNAPPVIVSTPVIYAELGIVYQYQVEVVDPDGDEITYSLEVIPPIVDMQISSDGIITWQVPEQAPSPSVTITAEDPYGCYDEQVYLLNVQSTNASISGFLFHDINENGIKDQEFIIGDQPDIIFSTTAL